MSRSVNFDEAILPVDLDEVEVSCKKKKCCKKFKKKGYYCKKCPKA